MRRILLAAAVLASTPAFAGTEFKLQCAAVPGACAAFQNDFHGISEDITGAVHYKALGPAEATGVTGIGVAAYGSYTPVVNKTAWKNITGSDVNAIGMAGIAVRKGLPFNIDVGATYTALPGTSAKLYGAELRYAILPGSIALPALALRASYTGTSGIDDFKYTSEGLDLSVSKGFAMITPYLGAGWVRGNSDPESSTGLKKETFNKTRVFAGARLGLGFLDITPEYERVGNNNSYDLLIGLSF
jgi:hypothetical protein